MRTSTGSFSFVTPQIATGAGPILRRDAKAIADAGVTAVINCRTYNDYSLWQQAAPQVIHFYNPTDDNLWNPVPDNGTAKPVEYWQHSLNFGLQVLKFGGRVLAYCDMGINRRT